MIATKEFKREKVFPVRVKWQAKFLEAERRERSMGECVFVHISNESYKSSFKNHWGDSWE